MSRVGAVALLLLLPLGAATCRKGAGDAATPLPPPAPGDRVLAVSLTPRLIPPPAVQDFIDARALAQSAGVRGDFLSKRWSELEPATGRYDLAQFRRDITDAVAAGRTVLVGVQVLNTTARELPSDLAAAALDAPAVRARFHALLDSLAPALRAGVAYLSIGNEVDAYLWAHPDEWAAYGRFYRDAAAYARVVAPSLRVGVTAQASGVLGAAAAEIARLNEASDVAIYTYYPLGDNFHPRPATSPATDIPRLVAAAAGKPVVLQEVGYPSAPLLGSSEDAQARFFASVFGAWRAQGGGRIPFLNVFLLHDFTPQMCDAFGQYYGLPNSAEFKAFLCSLGLRQANGTPKAAWRTVADSGSAMR